MQVPHLLSLFFKKTYSHFPAILIALAIGIATGAPQLYVVHQMGSAYKEIFPITSDDDRYYEGRSQEARDGFPMLGNPYVLEFRSAPSVSFWVPDATLSYAGEFLGLDVQYTSVFFDFTLPPILFLVTYAILLLVTQSTLISVAAASLFHLGFFLDTFTRSPSPQFNFLFVELAIFLALRVIQSKKYAVPLLGAVLGTLFYIYPYYWTFTIAAVGMFFLATLVRRELRSQIFPFGTALGVGTLLGSPVLYQMYMLSHSVAYQETVSRLGLIRSHTPTGFSTIVLCTVAASVVAMAIWRVESVRANLFSWFFLSAILGGLIASNSQIITGKNGEFSIHYFLPAAYITFLAITYILSIFFRSLPESINRRIVPSIALVLCIGATIFLITESVVARFKVHGENLEEQRYGPIMLWLRENTAPESVVLAAEDTSYLIAAYTPDRIFYSRNANLHIMTDEEVWTRFYLLYYGAKYDDDFFTNHVGQIWGAHYFDEYGHEMQLNKFRKLIGLPLVPAEVIPQAAKDTLRKFAASLSEKNPNLILGNRKIDYAISEPGFIIPGWMHDSYPTMHSVYVNGAFTIFALGPRKQ